MDETEVAVEGLAGLAVVAAFVAVDAVALDVVAAEAVPDVAVFAEVVVEPLEPVAAVAVGVETTVGDAEATVAAPVADARP